MPKISSFNANKVIVKFVVKSFLISVFSVAFMSAIFSLAVLKFDLDLAYCKYGGYIICTVSSFIVPYICLKPFKNNISILSLISIIPLVLFSLANYIFFNKQFVQLFISLAIIIAVSFVTGVMSAGKRR